LDAESPAIFRIVGFSFIRLPKIPLQPVQKIFAASAALPQKFHYRGGKPKNSTTVGAENFRGLGGASPKIPLQGGQAKKFHYSGCGFFGGGLRGSAYFCPAARTRKAATAFIGDRIRTIR
jgi:hypothetical protein